MRRSVAAERSTGNDWDDWSTTPSAEPWSALSAPSHPPAAPAPASGKPFTYSAPGQPYNYQPAQSAQPAPLQQARAQPTSAFSYQPSATPAPAPSYGQPMQPTQPTPTGYTGNIFVPRQGGGAAAGGSVNTDEMASCGSIAAGAASALGLSGDTTSKVQQMAAGAALDLISGRSTLEGTLIEGGANRLNQAALSFSGTWLAQLRYYFDVNNSYVLKKFQILLLPYRHTDWMRKSAPGGHGAIPQPPSTDPNAPDLYLPLMGLVTYILVAGFVSGADGRFTPEVLSSTAITGLVIIMLEVILIKLALYLLQTDGSAPPMFDVASCSGYKFIAAVLVLLTKTILGTTAGYAAIALAGANVGTFMFKTLRQCLLQGGSFTSSLTEGMGSPAKSERRKRQFYSLMSVALLQPLFFWYLSRV